MEQFAHSVILQLVEQIVEIVHTPQCSQQGTVVKIADLLVAQVVKETFDDTKCFRWTEFGVLLCSTSPRVMEEIFQLRTAKESCGPQQKDYGCTKAAD